MILDFYLLARLLRRWVLLLFVMLLILYAIDFLAQVREYDDLPMMLVAKMVLYRLPMLLDTALPYILFLAIFFTFAGLQNANAFDVMRASGYPWYRIMAVAVVFALIFGLAHTFFFDDVRVYAARQYQALLQKSGENVLYASQTSDTWLKSVTPKDIVIVRAKTIRDGQLHDVSVVVMDTAYSLKDRFFAKVAEVKKDYLILNNGYSFSSGVAVPLAPEGVFLPWQQGLPVVEDVAKRRVEKAFWDAVANHLRGGESIFYSQGPDTRMIWQGMVRPLHYVALAVLASVALLTSHHRTRSMVPFLVSATLIFGLHLGYNATMRWADQGFLPFWYAALWPSILLLFGSFLFLMRRVYG